MVVAVVVVLAVAVAGVAYWRHRVGVDRKAAAVAADNRAFANLQKASIVDEASSDYAQEGDAWMRYAVQTPSKNHRVTAYQQAGAAYLNAKEPAKALTALQKCEALMGVNFNVASDLATIEIQLGNKLAAINYLQQASKLIPASFPDAGAQRQLFSQEIANLKSQAQ